MYKCTPGDWMQKRMPTVLNQYIRSTYTIVDVVTEGAIEDFLKIKKGLELVSRPHFS